MSFSIRSRFDCWIDQICTFNSILVMTAKSAALRYADLHTSNNEFLTESQSSQILSEYALHSPCS